ncbi:hypothetical protein GA0070624_3590 [Micromonospora rhizosphaerae]|uniref:Serpin (Serine protease inhibitor) n=1 Tax=Micromonospora rhizosphaerae TaxID=568872 RepID=A0A1C6SES7_9ACTN|nr:hypothetical protein [Micromonospora rhizosphaerae]SCL27907.1 hypothetical protein GA0070624_3590 [Micromonospora rhizosphaerae]
MTTTLHAPLARYAARLHADIGDRHHVASPLGAWLLLALAGPAATGPVRAELAEILGMDVDSAAAAATALLDRPHPLVPSATAVWHRPGYDTENLAEWRAGLPQRTTTGPLPDQAALDAWAREHTLGLIERFPLTVSPKVLLALASALATRISWAEPFDLAPAAGLGAGSTWAGRLDRVLRTPGRGHRGWIASTSSAGDVAVHAAEAVDRDGAGLVVVSVVGDPAVAPVDVLSAAHEVSSTAADGGEPAGRRSLFDLPLGDGPLWSLREERVRTRARGGREERHTAVLPCWSARNQHDLTAPGLGFSAVIRALTGEGTQLEARQAAMARYGRYGFEAAAVTAAFALVSLEPEGVARTAELRFGHPYAVVAVATDGRGDDRGPWHGVPVFSAWVAEPEEPAATDLAHPPEAG